MRSYYKVRLGSAGELSAEGVAGNWIGVGFGIAQDLTQKLPDEWRKFNQEFIPIFLKINPDKSRVAAGLACGAVWTVSKGIKVGDIVLCPDGQDHYYVGEVTGEYYYQPDTPLQHRRPMRWFTQVIDRSAMSDVLKSSAGSRGTVCTLNPYAEEIEKLIGGIPVHKLVSTDETVEDPSTFAMEKHLEDFLVQNWKQTEMGRDFEIYQEDGKILGQQFQTDTGPIDILAVSKDKKSLLVIELKKGRASDVVVGQTLRYMGYVQDELAEDGQDVRGIIIALEDDQRIRRALRMAQNIEFFRYQVSFKLVKG